MQWLIYASLSAVFAALTAVLAKLGVRDINSNVATAVRTVIILIFAWAVVLYQNNIKVVQNISRYAMIFLVLSGITTALSWLFYFRALQVGEISKVVPIDKLSLVLTIILGVILFGEKLSLNVIIGGILMTAGAILISI